MSDNVKIVEDIRKALEKEKVFDRFVCSPENIPRNTEFVDVPLIKANQCNQNGRVYDEKCLKKVDYPGVYYDGNKRCLMIRLKINIDYKD